MKTNKYAYTQPTEAEQLTAEQLEQIAGGARRVMPKPGYGILPKRPKREPKDGGATGSW